jgi:RND family efflux transporter MFP subunit
MKTTPTLTLLAIAGLGTLGATILQARAASPAAPPRPHTGAADGVAAEGRVVTYPGAEVTVGADAIGRLESVRAEEGDRVRRGDTLALIDSSDLVAARQEAEARLDETLAELRLAEANAARKNRLFEERILPAHDRDEASRDVDAARARIETARATIRRLDATIARTRLSAPIDGVVTSRLVHPGQMVDRAQPAFVIADLSRLRIEGEAHEADAAGLRIGDAVEIRADGFDGVFRGRVEEIPANVTVRRIKPQDPSRPTDTRILAIKVAFDGENPLKLGATVDLRIGR